MALLFPLLFSAAVSAENCFVEEEIAMYIMTARQSGVTKEAAMHQSNGIKIHELYVDFAYDKMPYHQEMKKKQESVAEFKKMIYLACVNRAKP
ncbi:hypothetical protein [Oceanisphaera sp.]|uniref:hypothetical protein n=1 Tax=Oceanisphaera sp. TaxID=1929979 RepID=UPI003A94FECA